MGESRGVQGSSDPPFGLDLVFFLTSEPGMHVMLDILYII